MNYIEYCTPLEKAAISALSSDIRNNFLKVLPATTSEAILEEHFSGSYSRFYWYTMEITEGSRSLDSGALSLMRKVGEYLELEIQENELLKKSISTALTILKDLPNRSRNRANSLRVPILSAKVK